MSIELHPRFMIVRKAASEISQAIETTCESHGLTEIEVIRILLERAQRFTIGPLRRERHPDNPEKKADER